MESTKRLWVLLGAVIFITMFILGWFGKEIYRKVPPIPLQVETTEGSLILSKEDILNGQQVWQSIGGQQVGSIWGHGAYQAPDWSADWLHKEATALQEILSQKIYQQSFEALDSVDQATIKAHLKLEMRTNTYDGTNGVVTISPERAEAITQTGAHYIGPLMTIPSLQISANRMRSMNLPSRILKGEKLSALSFSGRPGLHPLSALTCLQPTPITGPTNR
jgi:nitric oxide reductase subunit B